MNQTIYFRKHIWERLVSEQDKSALINELLENHYNNRLDRGPKLLKRIEDTGSKTTIKKMTSFIDKDKELAVCKTHGTPLDTRGRCLQKGCKYA